MSLPLHTPIPKAASLIKRFQTTIDSLDGQNTPQSSNSPLKHHPQKLVQKNKPTNSPSPRVTPLNQIKRNLPLGTPSKFSPSSRSPAADSSPQVNQKFQPEMNKTTSNLTHKTPRDSILPLKVIQHDQTGESPQEQAPTTLDLHIDQPSELSNPLIDQPSALFEPSSSDQPPDVNQPPSESPSNQPFDLPMQPPSNQLSDLSERSPSDQPSDLLKEPAPNPPQNVSKPSDLRKSGATVKPAHNPKAAKPHPPRASLITLSQSQVKPLVPIVNRGSLSSQKHASLSASTAASGLNASSYSRQSLSQKHASLSASVAPRVKVRDPKVVTLTSHPTVSETRATPGKVLRKSIGSTASPKSTSVSRTTPKTSAVSMLAQVDNSATASSVVRKVQTSFKPVKEIVQAKPIKPVLQPITQVTKKTGAVKAKSAPLASADTKTTVVKNPPNAAPAKIITQISASDSSKPTKAEPKTRSVANNTSTLSKKLDLNPVARARVSVVPLLVADVKKPTNQKITAQTSAKLSTTASSNLKSTTTNKTSDLKSSSSKNRSAFVKASSAKLSTVPASGAPLILPKDKPFTKHEETLPPVLVKKELAPEAINEDDTQAQPVGELEPQKRPRLEDQRKVATSEEEESKFNVFDDRNEREEKIISMNPEVNYDQHSSQSENQDRPVSAGKELPTSNVNEDDIHAKSLDESEPLSHSEFEDQDIDPRCNAQTDTVNRIVNQNQPEEEIDRENSQADDIVDESKLESHSQLEIEDDLASVKAESTSEKLSEDENQTQSLIQSQLTTHSPFEDQDQATNVIEENPDQAANILERKNESHEFVDENQLDEQLITVDSRVDRSLVQPELDLSSQLVHASPPKEVSYQDVRKENNKNPVNQSEIPTNSQLEDEGKGALFEDPIDIANQFGNQDQEKEEVISQNSVAADLVTESTFKPHFQHADQNQNSASGKQVYDNGFPVKANYVETETNPDVSMNTDAISGTFEVLSWDAPQAAGREQAIEPEKRENEAHLLNRNDCNESEAFSRFEALDTQLGHNGLLAGHDIHRGETSSEEGNQVNPLTTEQAIEGGGNEIEVEKGRILPQLAVAPQVLYESSTEPQAQLDEYSHAPNSEESKEETNQFDVGNQTKDETLPPNSEGCESVHKFDLLQFDDESQVPRPEDTAVEDYQLVAENQPQAHLEEHNQVPISQENEKETHQFDIEDQPKNPIFPPNSEVSESFQKFERLQLNDENPLVSETQMKNESKSMHSGSSKSVGESRVEQDSQSSDQDQVTRSETPESEDLKFVYYNNQEAQDKTSINHELEHTSDVEVTSESEASQFVYCHHQAKQEQNLVDSNLKHASTVEALSSTTETNLSTLLSFDASLNQVGNQLMSKNEEEHPLSLSED